VSNLEAGPVARLYALWYEHNAPDDRWSVRTGLMLADSQFLQSDTAANFINNRISDLSHRQPAGLGTGLSLARARHSRACEAARRCGVPGRGVQRRSRRRRRLQSIGSPSDRDAFAAAPLLSQRRAT
jgi:hypothetical protein